MISIDMNKAKGVMLGQMCGDALGGTLEFSSERSCYEKYPNGLRDIIGKGPHRLLPGQITDDTELALGLARSLVKHGWDIDEIARAYSDWGGSGPFDCGGTCGNAFRSGRYKREHVTYKSMNQRAMSRLESQANGALMRISPFAIFGHAMDTIRFTECAMQDARLSHANHVCQVSNAVFCEAIRWGLRGKDPSFMWTKAWDLAKELRSVSPVPFQVISASWDSPIHVGGGIGWVLKALKMAFHELKFQTPNLDRNPEDFEESLVRTVMSGGDTDTNGAIVGALLGAWYGLDGIPERWTKTVLSCKTNRGPTYQCGDALELTEALVEKGLEEADKVNA